ncbi:MAG: hypothetical protein SGI77_18735 [Pirellulaceae bacterium]|nr:hypothetical protein [Pirellulaceae bacterium]
MLLEFRSIHSLVFTCLSAICFVASVSVEAQESLIKTEPSAIDFAEAFWREILSEKPLDAQKPLDLSGLLKSLGEIPPLAGASTASHENGSSITLVGNDEPILIGPIAANELPRLKEVEKETESNAGAPSLPPSNPLRDSTSSTPATKEDDSPVPLTSDNPRPRMVEVKQITTEEQESPRLIDMPHAVDAKRAREEDEKAIAATRPVAAKKTFVANPSSGKISSAPTKPAANPIDLHRTQRVENCLAYYLANPESVVERSPWAVMHAMLPFGVEGEIMVGGRPVNAIQWMCNNGTCRTQKIFTPAGSYFRPNIGGGVQGHEGQFLAMLAQSQVSSSYPIVVGNNKYTVADLVRYEMATCREKSELTFKLIGLSYFVETDQVWSTDKRSRWSIEKLVQEELAQPVIGSACGGTHRLMGLTFAVRQRQTEGRPVNGQFARAERFVNEFVNYAWRLQNPDGSFSTNWFESRGNDSKMERKVQTTGHILEWLAFTLPEEELTTPRFQKSIDFLLTQIWDHRNTKWPIGPRGHATRAIALYHQRTTGVTPGQRQSQLADQIQSLRTVR